MLFELSLLNAKLPESNSRCGRHVQRIYTVRHGDTNHIVGSRNRFVRKTISLSTHHNSQPGLGLQNGIVYGNGIVRKRHGRRTETQLTERIQRTVHPRPRHKKTVPIETRTARRFRGSQELRVNSTASMPRAAAERKMAPILVVSTTPSITTIRRAPRQTSSILFGTGRRMAQRTPRVKT